MPMDAIPPTPRTAAMLPLAPIRRGRRGATAQRGAEPLRDDQVTISRFADLLSRLRTMPDVRHERIERVQREIEAGTYETTEKLDAAVTALLTDLS
jgi:anti-sigma28 factor (negative regulator of flagellin synthesis)